MDYTNTNYDNNFDDSSKILSETLNNAVEKLQELLYTIPNIPYESVPAGKDEEDNKEIFNKCIFFYIIINYCTSSIFTAVINYYPLFG